MLSDNYLLSVIAAARAMTDRVEEKAVAILHERGDMANFNSDGQRAVEARVRELLGEPEAEPAPAPTQLTPGELGCMPEYDPIHETLLKAHQGLQFPVNDLRGLYGKVDPVTLIVVEGIHQKLVEAERELGRLVVAATANGQ